MRRVVPGRIMETQILPTALLDPSSTALANLRLIPVASRPLAIITAAPARSTRTVLLLAGEILQDAFAIQHPTLVASLVRAIIINVPERSIPTALRLARATSRTVGAIQLPTLAGSLRVVMENNCFGTYNADGSATCKGNFKDCKCTPTSNTCGQPASCDGNNCLGTYNADGSATCKGNFKDCNCIPTQNTCGQPASCDGNSCGGTFNVDGSATCKRPLQRLPMYPYVSYLAVSPLLAITTFVMEPYWQPFGPWPQCWATSTDAFAPRRQTLAVRRKAAITTAAEDNFFPLESRPLSASAISSATSAGPRDNTCGTPQDCLHSTGAMGVSTAVAVTGPLARATSRAVGVFWSNQPPPEAAGA